MRSRAKPTFTVSFAGVERMGEDDKDLEMAEMGVLGEGGRGISEGMGVGGRERVAVDWALVSLALAAGVVCSLILAS